MFDLVLDNLPLTDGVRNFSFDSDELLENSTPDSFWEFEFLFCSSPDVRSVFVSTIVSSFELWLVLNGALTFVRPRMEEVLPT